jgi:hypothetical protein|tara:strand:+ start:13802 stop:14782 length:981 start_codon:yes stop_codon:yes gene_type:complete
MSNELDEKFVEKSGGDVVPAAEVQDTVSPEGGEIKKKKADVKKSVDPKADKVDKVTPGQGAVAEEAEEADAEAVVEEVVEIEESIQAMFEGVDLSEEFKSKVTLVFEAAVHEAATAKAEVVIAEKTEALEVEMKESVDTAVEKIVENLDSYLDYVVEEWMKENELAIETGVKVEMAESLMTGLKGLFEEHNIEVDDETIDVVAGLEEEVQELKTTANEKISENVELHKQIASLNADRVFDEMTEDLTITQRERLKVLSEKLDVQDIAEYKTDLSTLKESFFAKKATVVEEVEEEQEIITEETAVKRPVSDHSSINALVESLNARNK